MNRTRRLHFWGIAGVLVVIAIAASAMLTPIQAASAQHVDHNPLPRPVHNGDPSYAVYLPLVLRDFPFETVFGAENGAMTVSDGLTLFDNAGATWLRRAALQWNGLEATEGVIDWTKASSLETEMKNVNALGMKVILVIRGTPSWAQEYAGYSCGPILNTKFGAFANFMSQVVARYSVPPYDVLAYEIWNEEDLDYRAVSDPNSLWGCWGNYDDDYYGGGYYAQMLAPVYPAVKAANPKAQVIVGGLLLDCDPAHPPPGNDCKASKFLEGIVHGGGGPYFDGVAFHAYDYYDNALGEFYNPNWVSEWDTTGTVLIAKANFLKNVLSTYSITGKFLMNTESAVLCLSDHGQVCDATWESTKDYYIAQTYAAAIVEGLRANIWYFWPGRHSELFQPDLTPLPAYTAFQTSRNELQNATFSRNITEYTGVRGYELRRQDRLVWILWSADGTTHSITLPGTPLAAYDVFGAPIALSTSYNITLAPIYLEWNP